jgi:transposase
MRSSPPQKENEMSLEYGITAGIDVHKKWLYVVIAAENQPHLQWEHFRVGSTMRELQQLGERLQTAGVRTVVMESTANYWKPVWAALEGSFTLYLAQAQSNAAPHGRKTDYGDATRLAKRLRADELRLSFVPDAEQRGWRLLTRTRVRYTREITRLRNRLECLLEEGHIKLAGLLSDLLGASGRRMLRALAAGETDPQALAKLGDVNLKASQQELSEALQGQLTRGHCLLLRQTLDRIQALEGDITALDQALNEALSAHQDAIRRLCAIPGVAVTAAREIVAELGPTAHTFPTAGNAASWVGVCPGRQQSAGVSHNDACAKGNRPMRRILNQCAWAAVRTKGSYFQHLFQRLTPRLGPQQAIWAVAHHMLKVVWIVLHRGVAYEERGPMAQQSEYLKRRLERTLRALRRCGIDVQVTIPAEGIA